MGYGGKGKGWGYYWGKGWGKGGKGRGSQMLRVDPTLKVWIGNLSENTKWKELQTHLNQGAEPAVTKWVEVFSGKGKGTGAAVFTTAEEAQKAIATLNGSELDGQAIVVDTWVKAEKPPEEAPPAETL
mmetsp:Transcript_75106/g.168537  ORF Transcript_75106/g.168537 Transcript_75106/m.168537 type:complete len:128 (-) Transcript_75106:54-437(-)